MIRCHLCECTQPTVCDAIRADWVPYYWDERTGAEVAEPVCLACSCFALAHDQETGEMYMPVALEVVEPGRSPSLNGHRWEPVAN